MALSVCKPFSNTYRDSDSVAGVGLRNWPNASPGFEIQFLDWVELFTSKALRKRPFDANNASGNPGEDLRNIGCHVQNQLAVMLGLPPSTFPRGDHGDDFPGLFGEAARLQVDLKTRCLLKQPMFKEDMHFVSKKDVDEAKERQQSDGIEQFYIFGSHTANGEDDMAMVPYEEVVTKGRLVKGCTCYGVKSSDIWQVLSKKELVDQMWNYYSEGIAPLLPRAA